MVGKSPCFGVFNTVEDIDPESPDANLVTPVDKMKEFVLDDGNSGLLFAPAAGHQNANQHSSMTADSSIMTTNSQI